MTLTEQSLLVYAQSDAKSTGLSLPADVSQESLVDFMAKAGDLLFIPGDPNLDNQKRNIAIRVFVTFTSREMFEFGRDWLNKWKKYQAASWHKEWVEIVERRDAVELTDILLSSDQNRVRQRLSMPFAEMLDFSTVLQIKRRGRSDQV